MFEDLPNVRFLVKYTDEKPLTLIMTDQLSGYLYSVKQCRITGKDGFAVEEGFVCEDEASIREFVVINSSGPVTRSWKPGRARTLSGCMTTAGRF